MIPFTDTPELFHLVSGVSGSNNIADLGTKRLGKTRLAELMNFCNLGYIVGSTFAPFSEHVHDTKQVVALIKSLKKNNSTIAGIIQASLIQNALSRCSAMSIDEGTMDDTSGLTIGYVGYFNGYFGSILFMSFEVQVWQMFLLMCLMVGIVCWTIIEVRGYKASLASWSELTDSMFEEDEDERRQAFASYSRWKRQQQERTHWVARNLRSWFAGNPSDFDRQSGSDAQFDLPRTTGTQTGLEMPVVNRVMYEDTETQSEKVARYRHLNIEECSDVELWMSIHHHEDLEEEVASPMQVDSEAPAGHVARAATEEDFAATAERARRHFWRLQNEYLEAGDYDGLDRFTTRYSWLDYV